MSAHTYAPIEHPASRLRTLPASAAREAEERVTVAEWCWSWSKRAMDIVCGLAALPIVVVLTALLAGVSAIVFRCNPFFVQARRGVNEDEFRVIKIRSLPKTFNDRSGKHEMRHHELDWWSNFLRSSHLDELPQVLNIIAGSMSVVGPRPMIDEVVDTLEFDDRATRALVKPGLTGPWQISTMGTESLHDHPELDNQYVEKASFGSDMRIILITAATVFGKKPIEPQALEQRLGW